MFNKRVLVRETAGWFLLLFGLTAAAGVFILTINNCLFGGFADVGVALAGLSFSVIGRILTHYRSENRLSWLIAWIGAGLTFSIFINDYLPCAVTNNLAFLNLDLTIILSQLIPILAISSLFIFLPALFPDGHFLSNGWRQIFTITFLSLALVVTLILLRPGPALHYLADDLDILNPLGITWLWYVRIAQFFVLGLLIIISLGTFLAVIAFIIRFRRSTGETRQQFKWFAAFLATIVTMHIIGYELLGNILYPEIKEHWSYPVILILSFTGFPVVIGITIFKYRLYDIDIIIHRTLVYSLLTLVLVLIYFSTVILLQGMFTNISGQESPLAIVVSTLVIAALFSSLRRRVQAVIDRRFFRKKYDAQQVLAQFAQTARDETDMEALSAELLRVVQETMQPQTTSVWLKESGMVKRDA